MVLSHVSWLPPAPPRALLLTASVTLFLVCPPSVSCPPPSRSERERTQDEGGLGAMFLRESFFFFIEGWGDMSAQPTGKGICFVFFEHVSVFKCLRVLKKNSARQEQPKRQIIFCIHVPKWLYFLVEFFFTLVLPVCAWHCQSILNWNAVWAIIKLGRQSDRQARVPASFDVNLSDCSHGFLRKGWTKRRNSVWMTSCK